jgi:hypothetical protein
MSRLVVGIDRYVCRYIYYWTSSGAEMTGMVKTGASEVGPCKCILYNKMKVHCNRDNMHT